MSARCKHCGRTIVLWGGDGKLWVHKDDDHVFCSMDDDDNNDRAEPSPEPESSPASEAQAPAMTDKRPKCPDCNSVGMRHCSDPEHCGGVYWPDSKYQALRAELHQLRARVAILDAQEVKLPEKESPTDEDRAKLRRWEEEYPNESSSFWAVQLVLLCRERQLLDALRAVQACRGVARNYRGEHREWGCVTSGNQLCGACKAYDALAGKGGE